MHDTVCNQSITNMTKDRIGRPLVLSTIQAMLIIILSSVTPVWKMKIGNEQRNGYS